MTTFRIVSNAQKPSGIFGDLLYQAMYELSNPRVVGQEETVPPQNAWTYKVAPPPVNMGWNNFYKRPNIHGFSWGYFTLLYRSYNI